jgi:uncharacterized protein YkwD
MRPIRQSWQATRHRRSFVMATGFTVLAVFLSCILGARPVANSVGLDQPSYQPTAGVDQQALRALIGHVCNLSLSAPDTPCSAGVRAALFRAFNVSQNDIERQVQQGNTPFAALHIYSLNCPAWEQAMARAVASLGKLVQKQTITLAQSDEVIAWLQDRQDSACAFVASSGVFAPTPTPAPLPPGSSHSCPPVAGHENADVEARLLDSVNQARANAGVAALSIDPRIHSEALVHSEDMTCYGMSHFVPPGTTPESRMAAAGVKFTWGGENIGWSGMGSDWQKVMWLFNMMMAETPPNDGHRKNILNPHFTRTGIGIYVENASARLWLTEDFAG